MPPKRRKFESTFPAARIKKIMQLDDDVGRVASSVPVVISRAVEIFLQTLLTRADQYAGSRNAKTLTVSHLKHCIEEEKQWDFLKELTAKIPDISAEVEEAEEQAPSKRGRKRNSSPSRSKGPAAKRKQKSKAVRVETERTEEESGSESGNTPERRLAPPTLKSGQSTSTGSNLATTSMSSQTLPGAANAEGVGLLGQYQKQWSSGCSGPLSIPALIAAGSSGAQPNEDSDEDYD